MNLSLLDRILDTERGLLVTLVRTEGHTYKSTGAKALYEMDDPIPVYGNLGSLCVDQEIVRAGKEAGMEGKPRVITIDTSEPADVHFGSGTFCGGVMELLVEPVLEAHKTLYKDVRARLLEGRTVTLRHDTREGSVSVVGDDAPAGERWFVETFVPPSRLCLFGATPLARHIIEYTSDMDFVVHVIDWRPGYLQAFDRDPRVTTHEDDTVIDRGTMVLLLSHSYERDKQMLRAAIERGCAYVGMLSSRSRRDKVFDDLEREGVSRKDLERVFCPVGLDLEARSDAEIAVSIVAELIKVKNQ